MTPDNSAPLHRRVDSGSLQRWPDGGLEYLGQCPVCQSASRSVLYENLTDRIFFCAPGSWTLFNCGTCNCAYLDPRPTVDTISLAYRRYLTHERADQNQRPSMLGRLRRLTVNGYLNARWKTARYPSSFILGALLGCFPALRARLDGQWMRSVPCPASGRTLLDVGCGNGAFLDLARSAGWRPTGVDIDAKAIQIARKSDLDVYQGGIDSLGEQRDRFDAITLSHVIEHVHEPSALLRGCYRLLKPGGFFWIESPNLDSYGHTRFLSSWSGLDPPRHLVMFRLGNLIDLLRETGFSEIHLAPWRPELSFTYHASEAISYGGSITRPTTIERAVAYLLEVPARFAPHLREHITLIATKDERVTSAKA